MVGEEKIIKCDLDDTDLFNCILSYLDEPYLDKIARDPSILHSKTIMNCLNAGLITCLRNQKYTIESETYRPEIELLAIKNEKEVWRISQVKVILEKKIANKFVIENIKKCVKFIKKGCKIREDVQFSIINQESVKNLSHFKVELLELKSWLRNIKSEKAKQEELFSFFKELSSDE